MFLRCCFLVLWFFGSVGVFNIGVFIFLEIERFGDLRGLLFVGVLRDGGWIGLFMNMFFDFVDWCEILGVSCGVFKFCMGDEVIVVLLVMVWFSFVKFWFWVCWREEGFLFFSRVSWFWWICCYFIFLFFRFCLCFLVSVWSLVCLWCCKDWILVIFFWVNEILFVIFCFLFWVCKRSFFSFEMLVLVVVFFLVRVVIFFWSWKNCWV